MNFSLKDIKRQFGQKAYSLGLIYAQKKRVLQIQRSGNLIRSQMNFFLRYFFVNEALPVIPFPIRRSDIPCPGIDSIADSAACNRRFLPGRDPDNW